jgi:hypothetical protein
MLCAGGLKVSKGNSINRYRHGVAEDKVGKKKMTNDEWKTKHESMNVEIDCE